MLGASRVLVRNPSNQTYDEEGPTVTFRSMAGRHALYIRRLTPFPLASNETT